MVKKNHDLVDLDLYLRHETGDAYLVSERSTGGDAVWLPKSIVEYEPQPGGKTGTFTGPEWLFTEKGLI